MINVNVRKPAVRLLIDSRLQDQVCEMDEDRYQIFRLAVQFAEDSIAGRSAQDGELPQFLAPYEDLQLVIDFCRVRERFVLRAIIELDDDTPPPGASAWMSGDTPAESILRAAGVDLDQQTTTAHGPGILCADEPAWSGGSRITSAPICVGDSTGGLNLMLTLSRLGLSGPLVTLTRPDLADVAHAAAAFVAPVSSQPEAPPLSIAPEGDSVPPVPAGSPAPGTSTDP